MFPLIDFRPLSERSPSSVIPQVYASSLGRIQVSFEGPALIEVTFNPEAEQLKPLEDRGLQNQIEAALCHDWSQAPQLVVYGTPFQLQVWKFLSQLAPGQTTTYGHIAKAIGKEGGAQAVGQAVKANPLNWIIPCHRVLPAQGGIGGFRWGPEIKVHLMKKDGC